LEEGAEHNNSRRNGSASAISFQCPPTQLPQQVASKLHLLLLLAFFLSFFAACLDSALM
jgi:hypothetical protein